jgi:hypothetical protein
MGEIVSLVKKLLNPPQKLPQKRGSLAAMDVAPKKWPSGVKDARRGILQIRRVQLSRFRWSFPQCRLASGLAIVYYETRVP